MINLANTAHMPRLTNDRFDLTEDDTAATSLRSEKQHRLAELGHVFREYRSCSGIDDDEDLNPISDRLERVRIRTNDTGTGGSVQRTKGTCLTEPQGFESRCQTEPEDTGHSLTPLEPLPGESDGTEDIKLPLGPMLRLFEKLPLPSENWDTFDMTITEETMKSIHQAAKAAKPTINLTESVLDHPLTMKSPDHTFWGCLFKYKDNKTHLRYNVDVTLNTHSEAGLALSGDDRENLIKCDAFSRTKGLTFNIHTYCKDWVPYSADGSGEDGSFQVDYETPKWLEDEPSRQMYNATVTGYPVEHDLRLKYLPEHTEFKSITTTGDLYKPYAKPSEEDKKKLEKEKETIEEIKKSLLESFADSEDAPRLVIAMSSFTLKARQCDPIVEVPSEFDGEDTPLELSLWLDEKESPNKIFKARHGKRV